ncbi:MAG: HAMP domain-containing sensor histidine kinase [Gemella sp.]|nr:HAMP domain-containing sensor histidine kinase [Gemella sp.]
MISSLRRKFIIVSASIITFVVSTVFIIVNFLNYHNIWDNGNKSINKIKNDTTLMSELVNSESFDVNKITGDRGVIIALVDSSNNVSRVYTKNVQLDEPVRNNLIKTALNNATIEKEAYVDTYNYNYVEYQGKNILFLVDVDRELVVFNLFLLNSLIVVSVIVIIVIILLIIMSKRVIAPLVENIRKQKQFITYASHELKTPLAIISSNSDLLAIENGNSKWLGNIRKQIDRLSALIASLIEFSKAEEKETLVKKSFSLTELIKDRVEDFEELAFFESKNLETKIKENVYYNGEYDSIFQVVDILLDNAIKYSDEESNILLELYTNNMGAPKLLISNKSKFTKKGNLDVVFDRFYREEHSRENNQGYGLGLSLAKLIIDRHGAKIRAYAERDGEFIIEIIFK